SSCPRRAWPSSSTSAAPAASPMTSPAANHMRQILPETLGFGPMNRARATLRPWANASRGEDAAAAGTLPVRGRQRRGGRSGGGSEEMRIVGRLLVVLAILMPVTFIAERAARAADGSANGTAVMKCMHWKDDMHLTPGLTGTARNQTVVAHGRVYGCNKAGGSGRFTANLNVSAGTCSQYSLQGTGSFDWANGDTSAATLIFQQQVVSPGKYLVSGQISSGIFNTLLVHA